MGETLKEMLDFEALDSVGGMQHSHSKDIHLLEIDKPLINADFLDGLLKTDLIIFLSKHSSSKEVASFTTHAEGNWSERVDFGGKPNELSVASPVSMLRILKKIYEINRTGIPVTYEATHHGPLLKTPSLFVELGGNSEIKERKEFYDLLARATSEAFFGDAPAYDKVAIGIGGTHYPERFTKLALDERYAFSHIMSKYNVEHIDMLEQALKRSDSNIDIAVVEWKSIKSGERDKVIKRLNELGLDYEKS